MKKLLFAASSALLVFTGCKSIDCDKTTLIEQEELLDESVKNLKDEQEKNAEEIKEFQIQEELKEIDIEKSVVYVEKPVYYPVEVYEKRPTGKEAAKQSLNNAVQVPQKFSGGTMFYDFDETFVYEIYCQPYRITDLSLEPGEMVLENPFISESQVWEMGAGVSRKNGQDVQHFYLKPDISGLTTSMIIITDIEG